MSENNVRWSLEELKLQIPTTPGHIILEWYFCNNDKSRIDCVTKAIDYVSSYMTSTRQNRQTKLEEVLNQDVVSMLVAMGFQASHDTQYGGHCDVLITSKGNFVWIAEAKVHSTYDWLLSGFQQLASRYSSGLPGQDHGGLLIYCYVKNTLNVMNHWKEHLSERKPDVIISDCPNNPLAFISRHSHEVSGLPYTIRHIPIALFFEPTV